MLNYLTDFDEVRYWMCKLKQVGIALFSSVLVL
jgi:hypothetical protein